MSDETQTTSRARPMAFTFGDPEPVIDKRDILSHFQSYDNGTWYEPPVSFDGLAKSLHANPHHESAVRFKVNQLARYHISTRYLDLAAFKRIATDLIIFGNAFIELRKNRLGKLLSLQPTLARWTRIKKDKTFLMLVDGKQHDFAKGSIAHLMEPDINQEIYGMPTYTAALQSAFLNEEATLYRRKYYRNGSHAGFILYVSDAAANVSDAAANEQDIDAIREALKGAKGPGNFRNLFFYAPNGKKDGMQLIPVSEVAAKDEFLNIKNISRDDVLAAHRIPPQLLGIVPVNAAGFGSIQDASNIFVQNEIEPLMATLLSLNNTIGEKAIRFAPVQPFNPVRPVMPEGKSPSTP